MLDKANHLVLGIAFQRLDHRIMNGQQE